MNDNLVNYTTQEGIAVLELCNPPVNGYSYEMFRQLDDAILKARFDTSVHVLVLRGAGEKFFCAGADIDMLTKADPEFKYHFCLHANETLLRLEHTPKLVIAALNGHCVGGGLEVALAADIRIAKANCGKIGLPEVSLGVLPGTGGTQRLARLLGKTQAIELMINGDTLNAAEAQRLGLVNRLFPNESFWTDVMAFAKDFCPPNKASRAVGHIKRAVQSGLEVPLESGLALERELQQRLFISGDAKEGLAAFLDKRRPQFTGR
ncbi:MAG: enoyl-CoA hydratase/isomerase family protein [Gammaproteobacteria bacterium]|nr:enoyl-CoA hydratase/isomerase family protein [Gammaproteobacteria bacterium]MCP5458380.1 enoyl-CoA hydratase/isomerase family protein [Gammaproteobacteria bacterium]